MMSEYEAVFWINCSKIVTVEAKDEESAANKANKIIEKMFNKIDDTAEILLDSIDKIEEN
jgi:hypothetical protein